MKEWAKLVKATEISTELGIKHPALSDHKPSTITIEISKNTKTRQRPRLEVIITTKSELGIEPTTEVATATKNTGNKGIHSKH